MNQITHSVSKHGIVLECLAELNNGMAASNFEEILRHTGDNVDALGLTLARKIRKQYFLTPNDGSKMTVKSAVQGNGYVVGGILFRFEIGYDKLTDIQVENIKTITDELVEATNKLIKLNEY